MLNLELLKNEACDIGYLLSDEQLLKLDQYAQLLVEWNEKINLTAITEPDDIVMKHFIDSFLLLNHIQTKEPFSLIDVGTGAGFPSLPCKIICDSMQLTMLDSLNKRINFLNEVVQNVGVKAQCIHGRAEESGKQPELREKFTYATARAVAHLRELSEYCLPFVKVGGYFVALKGFEIEEELEEAKAAIKVLGGQIVDVKKYELKDSGKRAIVVVKKISQTPTKYPRSFGKMKKQPIM
ncbi:16S rRNA (guanine(527)-N(7))-methyltransferase RsmG [Paludicola sp. MB14-C6]|uniref:16S rRNA (guanine(527)-N(7))-methyltransferase RsmG n=1 Tax=Paludihabitans sp. MB14-C6 TaxID=3070656 RepID=UPI0027DD44C4|nr:16S rRNA (guanine(527)-N(7))-methyltransferase RsmG [Paludicola sp. MB14-C6]WMJ21780.1 16S rRNA (guanine(527)-N(7))-methyltransferase RsmG [Paludicola sp. MB14-C6]